MRHHEIIIIGAGISGLSAASTLAAQGRDVLVLEKSRGVSGRAATRRWSETRVDHGAQFFTARSASFKTQVESWEAQGVCFPWATGLHSWSNGLLHSPSGDHHIRYACVDGMNSLGKSMASGINVLTEYEVQNVQPKGHGWEISSANGEEILAHTLIVTTPVVQALKWITESLEPKVLEALQSVRYGPSICVVIRCEMAAPEWQGIQISPPHTLSWIADDTSRRRFDPPVRTIVMHGSAQFSAEWQDRNLEKAADAMLHAAEEIVGGQALGFSDRMVHRWRYALVTQGIPDHVFIASSLDPPVYFCGDAFAGAKVEGAWLSGQAVAAAISQQPSGRQDAQAILLPRSFSELS